MVSWHEEEGDHLFVDKRMPKHRRQAFIGTTKGSEFVVME